MRILYVEDNPRDADLAQRWLRKQAPQFALETVATQSEAVARLTGSDAPPYDLVLTDLRLPDGDGLSLLNYIRERGLSLAVVVITGAGDEETAVVALKAGADDYVAKRNGYLEQLPHTLESALYRHRARTARQARPLKVLYAEHHHADVDLTRRRLQRYAPHIQLDVAPTATEALARLSRAGETSRYDVILLDYRLPGLNALEALKELRQDRGLDIPVVLVTGQGDEEVALQALKLGAASYVVKNPGYLYQLPGELENACYQAELMRERAALRESEKRHRDLVNQNPAFICTHNLDGLVLSVNPAAAEALGFQPEELAGRDLREGIHPSFQRFVDNYFRRIRQHGSDSGLMRVVSRDGRELIWEYHNLLYDNAGEEPYVLGYAQDVTERKRAEAALVEKESHLREAQAIAHVGSFHWDVAGNTVAWSDELYRIYGLEPGKSNITYETYLEQVHPDHREQIRRAVERALTNRAPFEHEYRIIRPNGVTRWVFAHVRPVVDAGGNLIALQGICQDITERKRTKESLRESEVKNRAILRAIPDWMFLTSEDGVLLDYHAKDPSELYISPEEFLGKNLREVLPPEIAEELLRCFKQAAESGDPRLFEYSLPTPEGDRHYEARVVSCDTDKVLSIVRDITERKRAEQALRESEERFSTAFHFSPQPMSIVTLEEGRFVDVNERFLEVSGYSREEVIGHTSFELNVWETPEARAEIVQPVKELGRARNVETKFRTKSGELRMLLRSAELMELDGQQCLLYSSIDITERKRAEQALSESEERFSKAFHSSPQPMSLTTLEEGRYIDVNERFLEVSGYAREEVIGHRSLELNIWESPEARAELITPLKEGRMVRNLETKFGTKRGEFRVLLSSAELIELGGQPCVLVASSDITERKQAEAANLSRAALRADVNAALAERDAALQSILQQCAEAVVRHLDAAFARIWTLNYEEGVLELQASAGLYTHLNGRHSRVKVGELKVGQIAKERQPHLTNDVYNDPQIIDRQWAREQGMVAFAGYPLLVEDRVVGVMTMFARHQLTEDTVEALATAAAPIAQGIERKRAEQALGESEARFRSAFDHAAIGMALVAPDGRFLQVNHSACELFGYSEQELLATDFQSLTHPDDLDLNLAYRRQILAGEIHTYQMEKRYIHKRGHMVWALLSVSLLRDAGGQPLYFISQIQDITEQKQAVEALRESEARFRNMADNAPVTVWMSGPDDACIYLSQSWYEFTGQTPETGLGFGWVAAIHPDDRELLEKTFLAANEKREAFRLEYRLRRQDGEYRWVIDAARPRFGSQGEFLGYIGSVVDITETKRAELNTQFINQLDFELSQIADADEIIRLATGRLGEYLGVNSCYVIEVNPAADLAIVHESWVGWRQDAPSAGGEHRISDYITPESREELEAGQATVVNDVMTDARTREFASKYESFGVGAFISIPALNEKQWEATLNINHPQARDWRPDEAQLMRDVTARLWPAFKRARAVKELRESEERFRELAENIGAAFFITEEFSETSPGRVVYVSPAYEQIWGRSRESVYQDTRSWLDAVHSEDRQRVLAALQSVGQAQFDEEFRIVRPDGEVRWVHDRVFPIRDEGGEIYRLAGIVEDITERKQIEEALRESQSRYSLATAAGGAGVWDWNLATGEIYVDPALKAVLGFEDHEIENRIDDWGGRVHPEDADRVMARAQAHIDGLTPYYEVEHRMLHKDGSVRCFLARGTVIEGENGHPRRMVGTDTDITERKRAGEALRESEERLRLALEAGRLGAWEWDVETNALKWSKEHYTVMGLEPFSVEPNYHTWADQVHPDDLPAAMGAIKGAIEEQREYRCEYRIIWPDGSVRWVEGRGKPVYDNGGRCAKVSGLIVDITERKRAESRLQAQYATSRILSEATSIAEAALRIIQSICESLDWEFGEIWEVDREAGLLNYLENWRQPTEELARFASASRQFTFPPGTGLPGRVWERREPVWVTDVVSDSNFPRAPFAAEAGLRSGFGFPILLGDDTLGVMVFFSREARKPDEDLLRMMASIGSQVGQFIERKLAEEALRESEERARRTLVEQMLAGVAECDANKKFVLANQRFCEITGYTEAELLEMRVDDITHPDDLPGTAKLHQRLVETGESFVTEKRYRRKDGSEVWVNANVSPIRSGRSGVEEAVAVVIDITDRKRAEREREQLLKQEKAARAEAQAANRSKDEFLAVVSHELRSPLNSILGYTRLLRTGMADAAEIEKTVEIIERNGRMQLQLIEDLLDSARIISGKLKLEVRPVSLISVINAALDVVRPAAKAKGIELVSNLNPLAGQITGDPNRLQQVVWNLLSNAIKFTPDGGRVELRMESVDQRVRITVKDTGKGIEPEFLPFVFDRFRQSDSSSARRFGGLGLGLSLVKQLVELHGGTIEAASDGSGRGATFTVTLPQHAAQTEAFVPERPRAVAAREAQTDDAIQLDQVPSLAGVRVLVVDDEEEARSLLKMVLGECGAQVTAVSSGGEALAILADPPNGERPDALILDINMPDEDGYQVLERVRALEAERGVAHSARIPAIALTAMGRTEDRLKALAAGFRMHVVKPVEPTELAVVIASLVERLSVGRSV